MMAVDELRNNVSTGFWAISQGKTDPALFFNDKEWNQMYLKNAFMQLELGAIVDVDDRANEDLARIVSDYAHERWAASRMMDPMIWRPVTKFMNGALLKDMEYLFHSQSIAENHAAALCCANSNNVEAMNLLNRYPGLEDKVNSQSISWETLQNRP